MADNTDQNSGANPNLPTADEAVQESKDGLTSDTKVNNKEGEKPTTTDGEDNEAERELLKKKATQLFLLGKRNILIHDFQSAVGDLGTSCQLFKLLYEEQADEMGDIYFYYGKALFELARAESDVIAKEEKDGEDDEECEEEEDEKDGGKESEKEGEKESAKEDEKEGDKEGEKEGAKEGEKENDAEKKEENNSETCNNEEKDKNEEPPKENTQGENENGTAPENEPVNDLQLSWEYLELAKLIYERKADHCTDTAVKLAEVYLLLGENGLESENYQTAIDDMKYALAIQRRVLPEEDRRIAETYYHLGVAHSLYTKIDEAVMYFKSAIGQLEKKIASLEARKLAGEKTTEEEERDAFYTMDGEIENIQNIIRDIDDKISDMRDLRDELKAEAVRQIITGNTRPGASTECHRDLAGPSNITSTRPIRDISHLIRKKRRNENDDEQDNKRPRQDDDP